MKIKDKEKWERPRERLARYGAVKLRDDELLGIILCSGIRGRSALDLAKAVLAAGNGSLAYLTQGKVNNIRGLGTAKKCCVLAIGELMRRQKHLSQPRTMLSPKDVWSEMRPWRDSKKEHFVVFYLNAQNELINRELISIGTLNCSLVHPREVFEPAISRSAAAIIASHNHPSGNKTPSEEDIRLTARLTAAGKILGIEIIDHVIVTGEGWESMKERNLL